MWAKKLLKFGLAYTIVVYGIYIFDYIYMTWLAVKFGYWMFIPLFPSVFFACWAGIYIYDFFNEDVLLVAMCNTWLEKKSRSKLITSVKEFINNNPHRVFVFMSTIESPFHAYLLQRKDKEKRVNELLGYMGEGSLYCAIFYSIIWPILLKSVILIWNIMKNKISTLF